MATLPACEHRKVFDFTGIVVSAFAEATVQKGPFIARGNGGSGLIVLEPLEPTSLRDLLWYAAYINESVRWRFSFGRMVTVDRFRQVSRPTLTKPRYPTPMPSSRR